MNSKQNISERLAGAQVTMETWAALKNVDNSELLMSGLEAAEGAQVTMEAWAANQNCDPANNDNYCRLLGWIKTVRQAIGRDSNQKPKMNKTITVQWVKEEEWGYKKAMRVVESDHPRFTVGSLFDFGFFSIATDEGYMIVSRPIAKTPLEDKWKPKLNTGKK